MNNYFESADGGEGDFVRLSQYNDLIRRPIQWMNRERRLLWAFLDDVIRGYLWIMRRSTKSSERRSSKSDWFYRRPGFDNGLLAFRTICELLEIDPVRVITRPGPVRARDLPLRRQRRVATPARVSAVRRKAKSQVEIRDERGLREK
jgi:hypothetical protein